MTANRDNNEYIFHNGRWMDVDEYLAILENEYWDAYDATHEDDGSEIYD